MTAADRAVERVDRLVTERPAAVIAVFLVVSVVAAGGLAGITTSAGADQFTQDIPAQRALDDIDEEFETSIGGSATSGQLIVTDDDVLSRSALVRILETQARLESRSTLRVASTSSHADAVARQLDPAAETPEERRDAVAEATPAELRSAIADADEAGAVEAQVSTDYNPTAQRADAAIVGVTYDLPEAATTARVTELQTRSVAVVDSVPGNEAGENAILFGDGILQSEITALLSDTAIIVFPAALLLILGFLVFAYRDPIDMAIGLAALLMSLLWTFGFMGYAQIPFSDSLVTVFPLLLAVGIDFGIHVVNRYREERGGGVGIAAAMRTTTDQLSIAFLLVTITTVFGLVSNVVSPFEPNRDFGIVAAAGIVFTLAVFGVFLPAAKVLVDRWRERLPIPEFGTAPLGSGGSRLGRVLRVGVDLSRIAPVAVVAVLLVGGAVGGAYGTGVNTEFSEEAFFPDEDRLETYSSLPEPFAPTDYTFLRVITLFEEEFEQGFVDSVTLYVDQSVRDDDSLELIDRTARNPPDTFETTDERRADATSVVTVIEDRAAEDEEFGRLVDRNDRLGTGVPDRNVDEVYDALLDSPAEGEARGYLAADRGSARIDYTIRPGVDNSEAVANVRALAERTPLEAVPTGELVVNEAVIDRLTESAIRSLLAAFALTAVFLALSYAYLEGRAVYGLLNLVPVLVTVGLLVGSMRLFEIPLTPINAPILSVSIGLGVDYTVHFVHRFVDEFKAGRGVDEALDVTIAGTGGALTGSMLTTVGGLGVLWLAVIPLLRDFGVLLALGVLYAYLCSILLVPSLVVVWDRYGGRVGLALDGGLREESAERAD
ncbi:MMPL family transporter [Halorubrum sp. AD140]|uniref:efflux RND transporter permease subunit n=1 Tax=Halorubrum sp. AD140 TaxID=3050073 RepID=UPI002ACC4FA4|nr:MMPL family transporter [Halorubrum sp. AD140]MDZ5810112.1 MMPL family transporter [Halorubrum sp. AD140]